MTKRELYIEKIKPFIDKDIIKVLTGIRRSGKSVMLKLIMEELKQNKIDEKQFININFENLINRELTTADKLHEYILKKATSDELRVLNSFIDKASINIQYLNDLADWTSHD